MKAPQKPSTVGERLNAAATALASVGETPRLDAEILMAHALGWTRAQLFARLGETPNSPQFDALMERRLAYEPIAYILGEWEFFSMTLKCRAPILVPRPETEHLVEAVLEVVETHPGSRILEIGTGSGCVAVALAAHAPDAHVVATDINPQALSLARHNAEYQMVEKRIEFRQGSLFEPIRAKEQFTAICSNPPYVEENEWPQLPPVIRLHEDPKALLAGADGLDIIRQLVQKAMPFLEPGGLLALEIGMGQYEVVLALLKENGYVDVDFKPDLAGIPRIAIARKPGELSSTIKKTDGEQA